MKLFLPILALLFMLQSGITYSQEQAPEKIIYEQNDNLNYISVAKEELLSFDYAFQEKATSYRIKVPAYPTYHNKGKSFVAEARKLLKKAPKGVYIQIFDIKDEELASVSKPVVIKVL